MGLCLACTARCTAAGRKFEWVLQTNCNSEGVLVSVKLEASSLFSRDAGSLVVPLNVVITEFINEHGTKQKAMLRKTKGHGISCCLLSAQIKAPLDLDSV
jgi:hypothetical protein